MYRSHWRRVVPSTQVVILILLPCLGLQACRSWRRNDSPVREIMIEPPSRVRVIRATGSVVDVIKPRLAGDTLYGRVTEGAEMSIPLDEIRGVEVRRFSAGKTILLVAGLGVTAAIIAAALAPERKPESGGVTLASCPLVYSWDGRAWRLDSGTFGGAITRGLQRTDVDNLDHVVTNEGILRLRVANELAETDYLDAVQVLAVDHAPGVDVVPDPTGGVRAIGTLVDPIAAADFKGRDALARVSASDGWSWESVPTGRDVNRAADLRDGLELTFLRPRGARHAKLAVDGNTTAWAATMLREYVEAHGAGIRAWYDSLDADPARAKVIQKRLAEEAFLSVSVRRGGSWVAQGTLWEAGPEIAKRQVLPLDLDGVDGDTVRVRLESVPSFWLIDRVGISFESDDSLHVSALPLMSASAVRGQDVRPRIAAADGDYLVLEPGDEAELTFQVPAPSSGTDRSYLLRSTGWYRVQTSEVAIGRPDLLARIATDPLAISRISVARMNQALQVMQAASR